MKILASDFDNTLLFHDQEKSYYRLEDVQAIKKFQAQGNLFGVCTGRSYNGVINWNSEGIEYDFYILCSGAKILDKQGNVIFQKFINKSLVSEILKDYPLVNTSIVYLEDTYILNPVDDYINHHNIDSLDEIGDEYEAFSLHFEDDEIAGKEYLKIKERFGKYIDVYQNECHLDFAPLGCSKGNGILTIIDHFNVDSKDMAVIGDSYNDIPMLKVVDEAFTFNRSPEKVKQEAKYLVDGLDGCISILMD